MLTRNRWFFWFCLALPGWLPLAAAGEDRLPAMQFIYHHDEFEMDLRNDYVWRVLRNALMRTVAEYGPYNMAPSLTMNEDRRVFSLEHDDGEVTISFFPARAEFDRQMIPVRIPVDRGLLGYRVLLIRAKDQIRFDKVRLLADLRQFTFGFKPAWDDAEIMRQAGVTVVPGGSYDGLFKMLAAGRFDAFSRSASEVTQEFELHHQSNPDLVIEKNLLLHYPLPAYFWLPNSPEGRLRAERVRKGMDAMLADGSLEALFNEHFGPLIAQLDLDHRRVIELPNPLLGPHEPFDDIRLWYRPAKARAE